MKKLLAPLLVFALILGACGGGGDDESSSSDGSASSEGTTPSAKDGDNGSGSGDGGSSSGGAFCDQAEDLDDTDFLDDTSMLSADFFDRTEAMLEDIVDAAPSEIRGDVQTILDGFRELGEILGDHEYNFFDPDLQKELEDFDTDAFEEAGTNIEAYLERACGISADDDTAAADDDSYDDDSYDDDSYDDDDYGDDDMASDDSSSDGSTSAGGPASLGDLDMSQIAAFAADPEALKLVLASLGLDAETAQCLADEAEAFDFEGADMASILSQQICDTTLAEILEGMGIAIPTPPGG